MPAGTDQILYCHEHWKREFLPSTSVTWVPPAHLCPLALSKFPVAPNTGKENFPLQSLPPTHLSETRARTPSEGAKEGPSGDWAPQG